MEVVTGRPQPAEERPQLRPDSPMPLPVRVQPQIQAVATQTRLEPARECCNSTRMKHSRACSTAGDVLLDSLLLSAGVAWVLVVAAPPTFRAFTSTALHSCADDRHIESAALLSSGSDLPVWHRHYISPPEKRQPMRRSRHSMHEPEGDPGRHHGCCLQALPPQWMTRPWLLTCKHKVGWHHVVLSCTPSLRTLCLPPLYPPGIVHLQLPCLQHLTTANGLRPPPPPPPGTRHALLHVPPAAPQCC